jgi:outer membrane immunogenic protein
LDNVVEGLTRVEGRIELFSLHSSKIMSAGKRIMLRRILLASAGAVALTGAAAAGNPEEKTPPPTYQPPPNWTGFFSGMNVGGGFGSPPVTTQATNVFAAPGFGAIASAFALSQTGSAPVDTGGVIGGGQIGYNFQFNTNLVAGIETDINGLGQWGHGSFANTTPIPGLFSSANAVVSSEKAVDWLGTVRGRLGWLVTPTFLIYGDGGLAYGGVRGSTNINTFFDPGGTAWIGASGSLSTPKVGWTAGGGVEWMFMPSWSLKVEYLYYDLGHATWGNSPSLLFDSGTAGVPLVAANISTSTTGFTGNIVRAGLNYHFGVNPEERAPPPTYQPPPNWTGIYGGMNVGGAFGSPSVDTTAANIFSDALLIPSSAVSASVLSQTGSAPVHTGGVIGGGQIGYNFQFNTNLVAGIETDINGLGQWGRGSFANTTQDFDGDFANAVVSSEKRVDWLGTVRGRLGWLVTPTFLIYGDGGLAYGGVRGSTNINAFWTPGGPSTTWAWDEAWIGGSGSLSTAQLGWTAGGGVEWMFMPSWSLKVEYLYYDLGHATWGISPSLLFATSSPDVVATNVSTSTTRFTGNIVRAGLNYHF